MKAPAKSQKAKPILTIIGNMTDIERVLVGLDLRPRDGGPYERNGKKNV